jgi:sulfur relay (sulfurtransferase) complex TusBCD TusD component (DsrE family)
MRNIDLQKSLLIILCDSPFQYESAELAYEMALATLRKKNSVNIFLTMDGVYNAVTYQSGAPFHMRSISEKLTELIEKGANVTACKLCMELRGVKEDMLPEGLVVGGIFDLSEMVFDSDVILNF